MITLDRQNTLREQYRQQRPGWRPATEVYADLVRAHLGPESRVLDVGCGRGGLVEQLAHPLAQMVGVDPDWLSLKEHRLDMPRAAAISHALPFAAGSFDLIFASWVLEHLARPQADLAEMAEIKAELEHYADLDEYLRLARAFHWKAFSGADMPLLVQIVERLWDTTQSYRRA